MNSEEEIVEAIKDAGSRYEAAEKLLVSGMNSEPPTDLISRYV